MTLSYLAAATGDHDHEYTIDGGIERWHLREARLRF